MDHICITSLNFMNHGHTQTHFGMSRFNIGSPIPLGNMEVRGHRGTLSTVVGTKNFMAKEELTIQHMKNSQLVGGFVGSKSQAGTSNRISCQIWDIVFCKLMSFMNSSSVKSASTLESSEYSYAFVQDLTTDMLDSVYRGISGNKAAPSGRCPLTTGTQMYNRLTPMNSKKLNLLVVSAVPQQEPHEVKHIEGCKQSYADVTKAPKHTEIMTGSVRHESILCSKNTAEKKMIPAKETNNTFKRKKQNCRRKKPYVPDSSSAKSQNNCKKDRNKSHRSEQKKVSNMNMQNSKKRQKNITLSDMENNASNTEFDGNGRAINFTNNISNKNNSLGFKHKQKSNMALLKGNKREFQKEYADPHMEIPGDTLQNHNKRDGEFENKKVEDKVLTKIPSFSHVHEIITHKANRFHSDSSDSDDFIIFAISETEKTQSESGSEEGIGDYFSDCDTPEMCDMQENDTDFRRCYTDVWDVQEKDEYFNKCDIAEGWNLQEKDTDENDNQVTEDLKKINEKWQKMYSCVPGRPKEPKKVQFASNGKLKTIHTIIAWDFAYRAARIGPWQQIALDQERFMQRILKLEEIISPILTAEHRLCVRQRIMKYLSAVHS